LAPEDHRVGDFVAFVAHPDQVEVAVALGAVFGIAVGLGADELAFAEEQRPGAAVRPRHNHRGGAVARASGCCGSCLVVILRNRLLLLRVADDDLQAVIRSIVAACRAGCPLNVCHIACHLSDQDETRYFDLPTIPG